MKKLIKTFIAIIVLVLALGCLSLGIAYNIKVNQEEVVIESTEEEIIAEPAEEEVEPLEGEGVPVEEPTEEEVDPAIEYRDRYVGDYVSEFLKLDSVRDSLGKEFFSLIFSTAGGLLIGLGFGILIGSAGKKKGPKNKFRSKPNSGLKDRIPEPIEQKQIKF